MYERMEKDYELHIGRNNMIQTYEQLVIPIRTYGGRERLSLDDVVFLSYFRTENEGLILTMLSKTSWDLRVLYALRNDIVGYLEEVFKNTNEARGTTNTSDRYAHRDALDLIIILKWIEKKAIW